MNRLIVRLCPAIMLLLAPHAANGQELKARRVTDVTAETGVVGTPQGKGMAFFDYDSDGLIDIFVTGRAVGRVGRGIVFADLDKDGRPDLFVNRSRSVTLDDGTRLPLDSEGLLVPRQLGGRFIVGWDGPLTVAEADGPIRVRLRDTPLTLDLRTIAGQRQAVVRVRAVGGEARVELRLRGDAGKHPVRLEFQPVQADRDAEVRAGGKAVRLGLRPTASEIEVEAIKGAVTTRVIQTPSR
jgi:hypothetical protein